ncbi:MAG: hypothetical protein K0S74_1125 [Chlamydiales bacterium]|jgi:DNA-binding CsgD family transcriptional regulator|nr:hypothetical protein [Chlamydiales bacterium]
MEIHLPFIKKFVRPYERKIKQLCEPLFHQFGVTFYWFFSLTETGQLTMITSDSNFLEYGFENKLVSHTPLLVKPENYVSGVYFERNLPSNLANDHYDLMSSTYAYDHPITVVHKDEQGVKGFGFFSPPSHYQIYDIYVKNEVCFQKFYLYLCDELKDLLQNAYYEPMNLLEFPGNRFYDMNAANPIKQYLQSNYHGMEFKRYVRNTLSTQELQCLKLYFMGKTAKETAEIMNLSFRTVEHYLENVKNKLNCTTKRELIEKALCAGLISWNI